MVEVFLRRSVITWHAEGIMDGRLPMWAHQSLELYHFMILMLMRLKLTYAVETQICLQPSKHKRL